MSRGLIGPTLRSSSSSSYPLLSSLLLCSILLVFSLSVSPPSPLGVGGGEKEEERGRSMNNDSGGGRGKGGGGGRRPPPLKPNHAPTLPTFTPFFAHMLLLLLLRMNTPRQGVGKISNQQQHPMIQGHSKNSMRTFQKLG